MYKRDLFLQNSFTCFLHERDTLLLAFIIDSGAGHLSEQLQALRVRRSRHLIDLN